MNDLFGSILAVPSSDLLIMLILDLVILAVVGLFYKELLAISFDETFAEISNVPVEWLYLLLICMIALAVVMMMRIVGLIMVIALLTMPAAISAQFTHDMRKMMVLAVFLGIVFTTVGLWLSYSLNLTSGATIILLSGAVYLSSLGLKAVGRRRAQSNDALAGDH